MKELNKYIDGILQGNVRAIARTITMIENRDPVAVDIIKALQGHIGNAHIIGITGPPGAGKSTLTGRLVKELRSQNKTCGLILVDPSSPFTGGAILGDRVRMPELTGDCGVYIRSMGTRGSLGGLAKATGDAIKVLDAARFDYVIIETVGIGQAETDIVQTADTVVVVSVPGLGDQIQTLKAGIMEIADLFVVNKADRQGARRTIAELRMMLEMSGIPLIERPPVLATTAVEGIGIVELVTGIMNHYAQTCEDGRLQQRRMNRIFKELQDLIKDKIYEHVALETGEDSLLHHVNAIYQGETNTYTVAERIFKNIIQ